MRAFLVLLETDELSDADIGRQYEIPEGGIRLGNTSAANVNLQALSLPCDLHIIQKRGRWYVHDLSRRSQALLDGIPFQMNQLEDGAVIQIDPYGFEFCLGTGTKARFFERIYDSLTEDILTKAYNRRYFYNVLEWELRRYYQWEDNRRTNAQLIEARPMSLLMFDLDHFGRINKEHGHQVGDKILKSVVQRIRDRLRTTDIVARYGGEEFLIYLPDTDYHQAMDLGDKVRQTIAEEPFVISTQEEGLHVTISVGVSTYQPGMDADGFIKVANQFMLGAKEAGRNRVLG